MADNNATRDDEINLTSWHSPPKTSLQFSITVEPLCSGHLGTCPLEVQFVLPVWGKVLIASHCIEGKKVFLIRRLVVIYGW